jgi:NAD(P)-dependent dehydrogenase (short-subunit alcohol dehydrogenase family)
MHDRSRPTVLVTGANSGIGLHTAVRLGQLGYHVVGTVRSQAKAELLEARAEQAGTVVEPVVLDITDDAECERATARHDFFALVNNAAFPNVGAVEDVPPGDALAQLDAVVVAPMRLARLVLPRMRAQGRGHVVNVSSISAHVTGPLLGWYQASKHALSAVTDALRMEVAQFGIHVVLIEPGMFRTAVWARVEHDLRRRRDRSAYAGTYDRAHRIVERLEPRMGDPARVARLVARVLGEPRPRPRYRIGLDATLLDAARHLVPARVRDRAARAAAGL